MKHLKLCLALLLVLSFALLPVTACAELEPGVIYSQGAILYSYEDGGITIVGYVGDESEDSVVVPNFLAGYPVSRIAADAFADAEYLKTVYLPDTIMSIESGAIPAGVTAVRDYNLQGGESGEQPTQPTGEVVYQNAETGVTVVHESGSNQGEVFEFDSDPVPKPHLRPRALPGATPVLGQYGEPWVWLRKTPLPKAALEPAAETIAETPAEPEAEPTTEPTAEPTSEPTVEPTTEPTVEPTTQPTAEPTPEPTAEPTVEPTAEPTVEPTAEPTTEPTGEAKGANTAVTAVVAALVLAAGGAAAWFAARRRKGSGG